MMAYAVDRWGNRGDRIVLVHGSLGVGAAAFGEQKVLEDRFTLDVMTRRGYGGTPAIERVDIHRDASDLIELLNLGAGAATAGRLTTTDPPTRASDDRAASNVRRMWPPSTRKITCHL